MRIIVDRIENGIAVCQGEDSELYHISLHDIDFKIKEGDALACELKEGNISVKHIDKEYENQRRKRITDLYMKLKNKNNEKGKDI